MPEGGLGISFRYNEVNKNAQNDEHIVFGHEEIIERDYLPNKPTNEFPFELTCPTGLHNYPRRGLIIICMGNTVYTFNKKPKYFRIPNSPLEEWKEIDERNF